MGDAAAPMDEDVFEQDDEEYLDDHDAAPGRFSILMPRRLFSQDAAVQKGMLQVFARVKPVAKALQQCMELKGASIVSTQWKNKQALYRFSRVFACDTTQNELFTATAAPLVEDFTQLKVPSTVVVAYGVTGAGKTFTMQGTRDKPGLVPQALHAIFQGQAQAGERQEMFYISFCEIYNEMLHDLFAPPHAKQQTLRLKEDAHGHVAVHGLTEIQVSSAKEAMELQRKASRLRQSASTGANQTSSRSHAIFTVKIERAADDDDVNTDQAGPKTAKLHFVDLAGCERVSRTGNAGARLKESVAINSSLLTLARCLQALRHNQQHPTEPKVIPYRESKLTHLFKGTLQGLGRFALLINVSPAVEEFNETKRVLQYAALASKISMTSHLVDAQQQAAGANGQAQRLEDEQAANDQPGPGPSSEALAAAESRIEELLDERCDMEYELEVMERKVELLREELVKVEVEKETIEVDVRRQVTEDMQGLLQEAAAAHKEATEKLRLEVQQERQELHQERQVAEQLRQALQQERQERQRLEGLLEARAVQPVRAMVRVQHTPPHQVRKSGIGMEPELAPAPAPAPAPAGEAAAASQPAVLPAPQAQSKPTLVEQDQNVAVQQVKGKKTQHLLSWADIPPGVAVGKDWWRKYTKQQRRLKQAQDAAAEAALQDAAPSPSSSEAQPEHAAAGTGDAEQAAAPAGSAPGKAAAKAAKPAGRKRRKAQASAVADGADQHVDGSGSGTSASAAAGSDAAGDLGLPQHAHRRSSGRQQQQQEQQQQQQQAAGGDGSEMAGHKRRRKGTADAAAVPERAARSRKGHMPTSALAQGPGSSSARVERAKRRR